MKKASVIFLFIAFFAGCFLGYSELFSSWMPDGNSSVEKEAHAAMRVSASMMVRKGEPGNLRLPTENTLISFLLKYTAFSPQETRAELDRLRRLPKESREDNEALSEAIRYLSFKLGGQSAEEAKRLLEDKGNPENKSLYSELLEGWAETDFEGAMGYLLTHKTDLSGQTLSCFDIMTGNLVAKDPDKAVKWFATLTPGEREVALEVMTDFLPGKHPGKMSEFMAALTPGELSSRRAELAANWAVSDWESFKDWSDTLEGETQEKVFSSALSRLASVDLDKATEEFKKVDPKDRGWLGSDILQGMDDEDKSQGKALDWVIENKESFEDMSSIMRDAMSGYMQNGYSELTKKTLQLPEGELRDLALLELIGVQSSWGKLGDYKESVNNTFAGLFELADKIGDSQKRHTAVRACVESWMDKSPESARQWIAEKSNFSPQVKQELIERCDRQAKTKEAADF